VSHREGPASAEERAELRGLRYQVEVTEREIGDTLAALTGKLAQASPQAVLRRRAAAAAARARQPGRPPPAARRPRPS
jgi:hypothetical protein